MAVPVTTVRIDWDNSGDFTDTYENVTGRVLRLSWTRGRSADFSAEAIGSATIVLRNDDDLYTPDSATGPTAAQLVPGRPVHIYATYSAVDYPLFYGYIERLEYDPRDRTVTITCYDPLQRLAETNVIVSANSYAAHSARTMRAAVLGDFERGTRNLLANPSFATDTTGWTATGGTLTRSATGGPSGISATYAEWVPTSSAHLLKTYARLTPIIFEGETYRWSVYLRTASGTSDWVIELATAAAISSRTVTVTTTWQRFTVTGSTEADYRASDQPLVAQLYAVAGGGGTVRVAAGAVTRGQAFHPYADTGTGRWPNWVGNGDFEGGSAAAGWNVGFRNFIGNPSFETDTSGWSIAGSAFTNAATSITRVVADPVFGSARADVFAAVGGEGAHYSITGTFKAGTTYDFGLMVKPGQAQDCTVGIGDGANPSDTAAVTTFCITSGYTQLVGSWTPSADRSAAIFYVKPVTLSTTIRIDGAYVVQRVGALAPSGLHRYVEIGPGGGSVGATSLVIAANAGRYGYQSLLVTTPATSTAGVIYDFSHYGPVFVMGQQYAVSVWLYPSSNMPYKVGIAADKADGTYDEASTTGTATANVWTQVTLTWTPSADRNTDTALEAVVFLYQTDATARTFRVDGLRVIPGGTVDEFEMAHWDLDVNGAAGEAGDRYLGTASFSGSALSALSTINGLTLTRHWITAEMASPWYTYVTEDRVTYAAKASVETYNDDLHDMTQADIDRASIVNIVPVTWDDGAEHYSDADSVAAYGPSPSGGISGAAFFPDRTVPDIIGPALVARYADPRARPEITVQNRWPSQLARELDDMVTVNFTRLLISGREYVILRLTTTVSDSGNWWETVYQLEEHM